MVAFAKLLLPFFLLDVAHSCAIVRQPFVLLELNAENFFDCYHDEGKLDNDFLPNGAKRWSKRRFWNKLKNISKVIVGATNDGIPDLVTLEEVENDTVLRGVLKIK